jgi:hypothetical protein
MQPPTGSLVPWHEAHGYSPVIHKDKFVGIKARIAAVALVTGNTAFMARNPAQHLPWKEPHILGWLS